MSCIGDTSGGLLGQDKKFIGFSGFLFQSPYMWDALLNFMGMVNKHDV